MTSQISLFDENRAAASGGAAQAEIDSLRCSIKPLASVPQ
jgi:predicted outer membrane repeat protein